MLDIVNNLYWLTMFLLGACVITGLIALGYFIGTVNCLRKFKNFQSEVESKIIEEIKK